MGTINKTIAVIGASGLQGAAVIRALLNSEEEIQIVAISRSCQQSDFDCLYGAGRVLCRNADMKNPDSLIVALAGVYGVFFYTKSSIWEKGSIFQTRELQQCKNVLEAARKLQIHHLIYTGVSNDDENTRIPFFDSKYEVEKLIIASGISYTILRPVFFMENWLRHGPFFEEKKKIVRGLTRRRTTFQLISVEDLGRFVALAFTQPAFLNIRMNIATDSLTGKELAKIISQEIGKKITWKKLLPFWFAYVFAPEIYQCMFWNDHEGFSANVLHCRKLLEGEYQSFSFWVRENIRK